jgi:3-hexulose-6-phosphate synthase/6-phospho-3-hexuloisomerase
MKQKYPLLQLALDFIDLPRAISVAKEAIKAGCDIIEVGTPLIKSEGMQAIRKIKDILPKNMKLVADMKTMDVGRVEVEMAAKSGADIVGILGAANIETIKESIKAAKNYGCEIVVDMIEVKDVLSRVKEIEKFRPDYFGIHIPIDEQMKGKITFNLLKKVKSITKIPVSIAGGINSETVVDAVNAGADIIVVGGAITKSQNVTKSVKEIKYAMRKKVKIKTALYNRVKEDSEIKNVLMKVSTANISDAMHRREPIIGLKPITENTKLVGKIVTVRTYPGDWSKPVQAIDVATKGNVIIIDAGGVPPAVWGELATNSAIKKGLSGVIIWGGIRDVQDIKKLNFPAFAKIVTPQAGEPKGFGEINVPITISGIKIFPSDWVVADNDGIIIIPKEEIVEVTNRAMDVLERENRLRKEISYGSTLAQTAYLSKWEKK